MFRTYSRFPVKKAAALTLSLLFLLPLSACSKEEPVQWDPLWVEEFDLSEEEQALYRSLLEPVDVTQTCGDVKLHIGQTVSDGNHLYLPLTVILPESVRLTDYPCLLGEEPSASPHIEGLDLWKNPAPEQNESPFSLAHSVSPTLQTFSARPDIPNNRILCLLSFSNPNFSFSDQNMTLTFDTLLLTDGENDVPLLQGEYAITWNTGTHKQVIERPILDETGTERGTLALSPLGLYASMFPLDMSSETFRHSMALYGEDGSDITPHKGFDGSHGSQSHEGHWLFSSPINIDAVKKIKIGGYEVTL